MKTIWLEGWSLRTISFRRNARLNRMQAFFPACLRLGSCTGSPYGRPKKRRSNQQATKKKRSSGRWSDASETSGKSFRCLLVYRITASVLRLALEQVALLAGQIVLSHPDLKNVLPQTCTCCSLGIAAAEKSPVEGTVRHLSGGMLRAEIKTGFQACLPKKRSGKPAMFEPRWVRHRTWISDHSYLNLGIYSIQAGMPRATSGSYVTLRLFMCACLSCIGEDTQLLW